MVVNGHGGIGGIGGLAECPNDGLDAVLAGILTWL
jgi:hypothetical protein